MNNQIFYQPSKEEIESACQEIQDGWTERQRNQRGHLGKPVHWTVPEVRTSDLPEAVESMIESINNFGEKETKGD